ncbi:2-oxo-4-hydroxy-4-carboxy-5-ureidoimidazoline decarboxylase [Aquibacillus koreensis]|uniref:2-oxo-4-hydroxy-4-carboxy-5-ureidoimidazoline decarboxylase n=1 Tax=Aquibacillus koreensis TaxID=279446 RepID=A0A9X3WPW1_9BACI|nr:2-oxo-4-hydroxy-4-carboxy-5-ureidoimidazoline decarboxylase [Aquibacillus koreensis]MCT2537778.1 2-oxo-4-hydroxy-4-carboxy-5-ureidoimidazoline decarboxylase [Aquibacillus koreensis]MDC3421189.1 2-oxo-4-hydroxy-4-carboxy-5-ureidoimidazoline decarboxylase [Aquibacillus koreensis]
MNLEALNRLSEEAFIKEFGEIFEHSPWVAKKAYEHSPFSSLEALHNRMVEIVSNAPREEKLELIRSHPNLGDNIEMSVESVREQQGAGLKNLTEAEYTSFQKLNGTYITKFGFPFVFAVKGKNKNDIYQAMKERVNHTVVDEFSTALAEIYKIALLRLQDKFKQEKV